MLENSILCTTLKKKIIDFEIKIQKKKMKKVICQVIEKVPNDWSTWRKVIDREKYLTFDKKTFPNNLEFCENLENSDKVQILERIGSASADAEVYKITFENMDFAFEINAES